MRVPHELLRDTITVEDYGGAGALGPVVAAPRQVRASVQHTKRLVTDMEGRVVTVLTMIIIRPEDGPVAPESKITAGGVVHRVVQAFAIPDERRPTHWELMLERWSP